MYDETYNNTDFNYEDLERQYQDREDATVITPEDLRTKLDDAHKL